MKKENDACNFMLGDFAYVNGHIKRITIQDLIDWLDGKVNFNPIPITVDMLNANDLNPIVYCDLSMPRWYMSIRNGNKHVEMPFKFINQLQQALRLINMNDIADKINVPQD